MGNLDHPPPAIPPQLPAVLMGRPPMSAAGRDHGLKPPASQAGPQGMAVRAPIRKQAVGPLAGPSGRARPPNGDGVERLLEEGDRRRG